jgi:hypothetical protein
MYASHSSASSHGVRQEGSCPVAWRLSCVGWLIAIASPCPSRRGYRAPGHWGSDVEAGRYDTDRRPVNPHAQRAEHRGLHYLRTDSLRTDSLPANRLGNGPVERVRRSGVRQSRRTRCDRDDRRDSQPTRCLREGRG